MAKYSTGGTGSSSSGDSCELCGTETSTLVEASVAGANLLVCRDCSPHDDSKEKTNRDKTGSQSGTDRQREVVQETTDESATLWDGDTSHWEQDGTDYDSDPLPYLVEGYGSVVQTARKDKGIDLDELARDLGVDEMSLLTVEQGQAAQEGIGGSVIEELEAALDVTLIEE